MGRGAARIASTLLALVLSSACHTYIPVERAAPGATVRVHVPVVNPLSNPNAPPQTVAIEGDVLQNGDTLVLATRTRREIGAFREFVQYDTLRLSPEQRAAVELREFSPGRSVALGVLIAGSAVGFAAIAFGVGGGSDGEEGPGGTPPAPSIVVNRSVFSTLWGVLGGSVP